MAKMISLTIDGRPVSVPEGTLIVNAAKQIQNKCLCPLGEFSTMAVTTAIERFPADFTPSTAGGQHG